MGVQQSRARPRTDEVNAHLGNPGFTLRRIDCAASGEGGSAAGELRDSRTGSASRLTRS